LQAAGIIKYFVYDGCMIHVIIYIKQGANLVKNSWKNSSIFWYSDIFL